MKGLSGQREGRGEKDVRLVKKYYINKTPSINSKKCSLAMVLDWDGDEKAWGARIECRVRAREPKRRDVGAARL